MSSVINFRQFSLSCLAKKSHYDILGVTPNATMADIKKAYYNLTMVYHPDKSDGSPEALEKFRAISEAYEVLGNLSSKKLYDKGVLHQTPLQSKPKPSRKKTIYVPQHSGRTPIYDFEQWTRIHYGESVLRRAAAKKKYDEGEAVKEIGEKNSKGLVVVCCMSVIVLFYTVFAEMDFLQRKLDTPSKTT